MPEKAKHKRKYTKQVERVTPWGNILKSYAMTYSCDWRDIADLMKTIHPWCKETTAYRVKQIAEFGACPNFPEGLALAHICGLTNALDLLPQKEKTHDRFQVADAASWKYLKFIKQEENMQPGHKSGWTRFKEREEAERQKQEKRNGRKS